MQKSSILITWSSGFIGFHLSKFLLELWFYVVGIDNENDSYDQNLKKIRRGQLQKYVNFSFVQGNIKDGNLIKRLLKSYSINLVVHLAAEAGVRGSLCNPRKYIDSNLLGFGSLLEECVKQKVTKFIYASSSSIYSGDLWKKMAIKSETNTPKSLYAATKKANELIAYSYSHNYPIQCIWLRFFSVYWEWWRPDMLYFQLLKKIYNQETFLLYWDGSTQRDFTYIDDIIDGIYKTIVTDIPWKYELLNLWSSSPVNINFIISFFEEHTGLKLIKKQIPFHQSDSAFTSANISQTKKIIQRYPKVKIDEWMTKFLCWYQDFYNT